MRKVSKLCRWLLVGAIMISSFEAWAEMPPLAYANLQADAHEVLQIEVLKVRGVARHRPNEQSLFTITAKVQCVARSASRLTPGITIEIAYNTILNRPRGWVGPASIDILKPGIYVAYLDKSDGTYTPAALGQSFLPGQGSAQPSTVSTRCPMEQLGRKP